MGPVRRRSEGVLFSGEDGPPELPRPAEEIIAVLGPMATEARIARVRAVIQQRVSAVRVVVDALHDPHNGAAIVRTCDAFGVQYVHAIERDETFAAARSVARGSQKWIDVVRHRDPAACIQQLHGLGFELVATHPEGELEPEDLARIPRVALVMGNEHEGIAEELRAACKRSVRVPMRGFVESLNVSVTTAILLHTALRGRPGDLDEETQRVLLARALLVTVPRALEKI